MVVASRTWSRLDAASRWRDAYRDAPRGVTLCLVDLVDVRLGRATDADRAGGVDPTGYYVWELANVRELEQLPVKGFLNLCAPQFQIRLARSRSSKAPPRH